MAKIRIHELAKELEKQSKDILSYLQEKGIEVKSASSSVEEDAAALVRKAFATKAEKTEKPEKAEPVKPAPVKENTPTEEKKEQPKMAEQPKKKKTIIFVNNQNSTKTQGNAPRQGANTGNRPQGARPQGTRQGNSNDRRAQAPAPRTPIKPLTPPSPTPSVQMVPSRPQPKARPEQQEAKQAVKAAETVQAVQPQNTRPESRPERTGNDRPQSDRPQNYNRPQGERSQSDRPQNRFQDNRGNRDNRGGYQGNRPQGDRPDRGQFQNRGGNAGGRPQGDRQNGFQRNGRPGGEGGQGDRRGSGSYPGGNRSFNGAPRDNRGNGGQGAGYRDKNQGKGFAAEAPTKDMEKRREDEKRRASSMEKDKRSRKDHIYEEDEALKNKPGRFIKPEKKKEEAAEEVIKVITLPETITIKDLAEKMKIQPAAIVKKLFLEGKIVTVNQEISYEDAEAIAMEYEILCEKEVKVDVIEELLKEDEEDESTLVERPPVICVPSISVHIL